MSLVTRYDLLSQQNLEPLRYLFLFWIDCRYTPIALLLYCNNIKDWSIASFVFFALQTKELKTAFITKSTKNVTWFSLAKKDVGEDITECPEKVSTI